MLPTARLTAVLAALILTGAAQGTVDVRLVPAGATDARPARAGGGAAPRVDRPANVLFVPFYFVDPAAGDTTLFAVHNVTDGIVEARVEYLGPGASEGVQRTDPRFLLPKETYTVNLRDVTGIPPQPDGTFQGFVRITQVTEGENALMGDYFHVDEGDAFATGDRLLGPDDLCTGYEIRFLRGGGFDGGTKLTFLIEDPQGPDDGGHPPTALLWLYDEMGSLYATGTLHTDQRAVNVPLPAILGLDFGTLEVDVSNASGGAVLADYSAAGRYSVGVRGTCTAP